MRKSDKQCAEGDIVNRLEVRNSEMIVMIWYKPTFSNNDITIERKDGSRK